MLSYRSMFHVNIFTGSGVMTILFYKRLTRIPEMGNTPVWVLPNIWRLGKLRKPHLACFISFKMLLNATKCQGYSFYRFWVNNGNSTEEEVLKIVVNCLNSSLIYLSIHSRYSTVLNFRWEGVILQYLRCLHYAIIKLWHPLPSPTPNFRIFLEKLNLPCYILTPCLLTIKAIFSNNVDIMLTCRIEPQEHNIHTKMKLKEYYAR